MMPLPRFRHFLLPGACHLPFSLTPSRSSQPSWRQLYSSSEMTTPLWPPDLRDLSVPSIQALNFSLKHARSVQTESFWTSGKRAGVFPVRFGQVEHGPAFGRRAES